VAKLLKEKGLKVNFILTLDQNDPNVNVHIVSKINENQVPEYFTFAGKIKGSDVGNVVKASDAMILLSKLECFSSNVVEAWHFRKPLLISKGRMGSFSL
jgi:hypothetical protein